METARRQDGETTSEYEESRRQDVEQPVSQGVLAVLPSRRLAVYHRGPLPFAARFQAILIVVMFATFLLILQQGNKQLYQIGLPVLVVAAFLQIAFGNIPPTTRFVKSMGLLVMTWAIVAVLIVAAVWITPNLIQLGR